MRNAGDLPPSVHIQKDLIFWDFIPPDSQIEELVVIYRALEILLDEINQSNNQRVIRYTIEVHGEQEKVTLAANWEDAVQVLQLPDCRNDKEELKRQLDELIYTAETPAQKQQIQEKLESYLQKRLSDFRRQGAEDNPRYWLFWFLCGNEVYTDSFFDKIVLKVLPDKHFTIP
ncbi:hypothetical protein PN479_09550 [Microcystis aeruginosa CS-573]|nr:hypothetical protein [Microcystis aeruginosa]MDB9395635.1 hypothetical protein [Microcystis aeruginosa CS-573]